MNNFIFEIGVEEIPAQYVQTMADSLKTEMSKKFNENLISFSNIKVMHTPRRFTALVEDLAQQQTVVTEDIKGPSVSRAYDKGQPTKALIGFINGKGKTLDDIFTKVVGAEEYVFVKQSNIAKPTMSLLPIILPQIITSIYLPNAMRWSDFEIKFVRPIRWLLAVFDNNVVDFSIECCKSSNFSMGHRTLANTKITINNVDEYLTKLAENYIILDENERKSIILSQINKIEKDNNIQVVVENDLLDEITNLVEYPYCCLGTYPKEFLEMPQPIIITPMRDHQRYFPVVKNGVLNNSFVFVRNGGDYNISGVVHGNERVLIARLKDGEFFFNEDKKTTLKQRADRLEEVLYQESLGSMKQKSLRVQKIALELNEILRLNDSKNIEITTELMKADLLTQVVGEFSELQGTIGGIYAKMEGYTDEVCCAISEQYMPIKAGGDLPTTKFSALIAIADKLDSIMGLSSVGLLAKGSQDPYGLRRQTLGILAIQQKFEFNIDFVQLISKLSSLYKEFLEKFGINKDEFVKSLEQFFIQRMKGILIDEKGFDYALLDQIPFNKLNIFEILNKLEVLRKISLEQWFIDLKQAFLRVAKIIKSKMVYDSFEESKIQGEDEQKLVNQLKLFNQKQYLEFNNQNDYESALKLMCPFIELINTFFDNNLVLCDDKDVCQNRINFLNNLLLLYSQIFVI